MHKNVPLFITNNVENEMKILCATILAISAVIAFSLNKDLGAQAFFLACMAMWVVYLDGKSKD